MTGRLIAEAVGTFVLVFFGIGSVHVAVFTGALAGLGQVALVWGLGVGLAIYATAAVSGAHLNPAVTVAFSVFRGFPRKLILPYAAAQTVGAFAAAAVVHGLFYRWIAAFEAREGIERGAAGSERSAMAYGEYFPNPDVAAGWAAADGSEPVLVSHLQAFGAELVGTAFLVMFIFALVEPRNGNAPTGRGVAFPIGFAVAAIICVVAPLTQAGLNPARDFGPRLFSWFAGWGTVAIPGPRGGFFTVYILAPLVGGLVGAAVYDLGVRRWLKAEAAATGDR